MKTLSFRTVLGSLCVALGVAAAPAAAQMAPWEAELYEAAKKEKAFTVYSAHYNTEEMARLCTAFEQKYAGVKCNFVRTTEQRFAAVVVDVFSSHNSIPGHLVTQEFWQDTRRTLAPKGVLLINLILDGRLETLYARSLLATIESVYGRCAVEVLHKTAPLSNVIVSCYDSSRAGPRAIYTDERNRADVDMALQHQDPGQ